MLDSKANIINAKCLIRAVGNTHNPVAVNSDNFATLRSSGTPRFSRQAYQSGLSNLSWCTIKPIKVGYQAYQSGLLNLSQRHIKSLTPIMVTWHTYYSDPSNLS